MIRSVDTEPLGHQPLVRWPGAEGEGRRHSPGHARTELPRPGDRALKDDVERVPAVRVPQLSGGIRLVRMAGVQIDDPIARQTVALDPGLRRLPALQIQASGRLAVRP